MALSLILLGAPLAPLLDPPLDAGVPEHAPARVGKEQDAAARVDVPHAEVACSGEQSCRGAGAAGDVEAVKLPDDVLSPGYLGRRDVRDLRARQRRAEAAVESPELRAEYHAAVMLGERRAGDKGARR